MILLPLVISGCLDISTDEDTQKEKLVVERYTQTYMTYHPSSAEIIRAYNQCVEENPSQFCIHKVSLNTEERKSLELYIQDLIKFLKEKK